MRIQLLLVLLSAGTALAPTGSSCPAAAETPWAAVRPQEPKDGGKETPKQRAAKEKAAVEKLNEGLRSKEANVRQAALVDAAEAPYPEVIKTFGKVLDDRSDDVAMIAAELLGRMGDEQALETLRRFATRRKKALAKKPGLQEEVLRAIGRHRSPKSTSLLIKGAFEEENSQIRRARVFAVANLRTEDAAKAIFSEMKKTDVKRLRGRLANVRPALIYLTGTDAGQDPARWLQWWESNRKTFKVPDQAPKLSGDYANQWARFWGDEMTYERRKKRSDRG